MTPPAEAPAVAGGSELDISRLLDFLTVVAAELPRRIILVGAGGTAMTLLQVKPSTRDIDFTGPREDIASFRRALKGIPHGWKIDLWPDGQVFSEFLPSDYLRRSRRVQDLGNVDLRALHPVDIVVTKLARLDRRDEQDIEACIRSFGLTRAAVTKRAGRVQHAGSEARYQHNLELVVRRFFASKSSSP